MRMKKHDVPTWPSDSGNYEPNFPQTAPDAQGDEDNAADDIWNALRRHGKGIELVTDGDVFRAGFHAGVEWSEASRQTREDGIREAARAQCYWCRDDDGRLNPIPIDRGADYTVRFWHAAKVGGFEAGDAHCDASKIWTLLLPTPPPQEGGKE